LVFRDTEDQNDFSGPWYNEWPFDTWVDSATFQWLRGTLQPMFVNAAAEYPEPDEDEPSNVVLPHKSERNSSTLPHAPPPQKAVLLCPQPGQVRHLKWWLTKFFADHLNIVYMYAEMGNDEHTEILLKF
jgi:hypothetical protein